MKVSKKNTIREVGFSLVEMLLVAIEWKKSVPLIVVMSETKGPDWTLPDTEKFKKLI